MVGAGEGKGDVERGGVGSGEGSGHIFIFYQMNLYLRCNYLELMEIQIKGEEIEQPKYSYSSMVSINQPPL